MQDLVIDDEFNEKVNRFIQDNVENKYDFLRRVINRMSQLKKTETGFDSEKKKILQDKLIANALQDVIDDRDLKEIDEFNEKKKLEEKVAVKEVKGEKETRKEDKKKVKTKKKKKK